MYNPCMHSGRSTSHEWTLPSTVLVRDALPCGGFCCLEAAVCHADGHESSEGASIDLARSGVHLVSVEAHIARGSQRAT